MALPRLNRLKKKKDFQEVFKKGKGFKEDFLFLKARKKEAGDSRFGFVITKKASKKAAIRNKIKRKISEAVRARLSGIEKGWDGVFIVSRPVPPADLKKIGEIISRLFKKANLIKV